ncbi:hypothetical protein QBC43DRAFT_72316 [Cladorrhinum sp. PSN259]|nr:hypothetical protein QBC43DRAFT_72316 [Cladorrhinum sp. PSN259]
MEHRWLQLMAVTTSPDRLPERKHGVPGQVRDLALPPLPGLPNRNWRLAHHISFCRITARRQIDWWECLCLLCVQTSKSILARCSCRAEQPPPLGSWSVRPLSAHRPPSIQRTHQHVAVMESQVLYFRATCWYAVGVMMRGVRPYSIMSLELIDGPLHLVSKFRPQLHRIASPLPFHCLSTPCGPRLKLRSKGVCVWTAQWCGGPAGGSGHCCPQNASAKCQMPKSMKSCGTRCG